MRAYILLPFIFLLGLLLGQCTPQQELTRLKRELAQRPKHAEQRHNLNLDTITRMVQIPETTTRRSARPAPAVQITANAPSDASDAATSPHDTASFPPSWSEHSLAARIEEAKELWQTRMTLARTQWIERLQLTTDGVILFDDVIDNMNLELQASLQQLADLLADDTTMNTAIGVRLVSQLTTSIANAYDELHTLLPPETHAPLTELELTDFINPAVADPLIAVQDKLENIEPPARQRTWNSP